MKYGGLEYSLLYSDTTESEQLPAMEFFKQHLPADLVCAMANLALEREAEAPALLYALSPIEVLSAQWACAVLNVFLSEGYERSPLVFLGSQTGLWNSLMSRMLYGYAARNVTMIDAAETACEISRILLSQDDWQQSMGRPVNVVHGDPLTFDLCAYAEEIGADPIVLVPDVGIFDSEALKGFIEDCTDCNALFLLQGSNLAEEGTDGSKVNVIHTCADLEDYFDGDPIYSARIHTAVGDRFQTVFAT